MVVMPMAMMMVMPMTMVVTMIIGLMVVMMNALGRTAPPRILAEQQRLDRDRHGERGHPNAPEIDVIEIAQHQSINCQDLALDQQLLAQDGAQRLRHVAVEHEVERLLAFDGGGKAVANALREREDPYIVGRLLPAQRKRHFALALDQIEGGEVRADRFGELVGVDRFLAEVRRLQNLEITPRQKLARFRDVAGISTELHAVFGGAERGGADALAGGDKRPGQRA